MTQPLFVFGTLLDPDLVSVVIGTDISAFRTEPARVHGQKAVRAAHAAYPILIEHPEAVTHGLLIHGLTAEHVERIAFYETHEYELGDIHVHAEDEPTRARAFFSIDAVIPSDDTWKLADWQRTHKRLALVEAELALGHFGALDLAEISAHWPEITKQAVALMDDAYAVAAE